MKEKMPFVIEVLIGIVLVCVGLFIKVDYYDVGVKTINIFAPITIAP